MSNWELDPQNKSFVPLEQPDPVSQVAAPTPSPFLPAGLSSIGALLKGAWKIYKEKFWTLLSIMVLPLISVALTLLCEKIFVVVPSIFPLIFTLAAIILGIWAQVSLICAISDREQKISFSTAFSLGRKKIWSYLWISFLVSIITVGGTVLLIIPGIILSIWFSLATYVLVAENYKGFDAILRSKQLVSGHWGKVLLRFFVIGIIPAIITIGVSIFAKTVVGTQAASGINGLASLLITPFCAVYSFLIYEDLKRIKTGVLFVPPKAGTKAKYILLGVLGFITIPAFISLLLFLRVH
jgi:hypothetical protein